MSSDAIVLAGAAALAVGALHKGWFVDRWEDLNDKYEMEEKAVRALRARPLGLGIARRRHVDDTPRPPTRARPRSASGASARGATP
jgi:hypothetical protein